MQYSRRSIPSFIVSVCALLVLSVGSSAVRLQISDKECFRENIAIAQSQITLTVVSDDLHGKPVYFDVMARDPRSEVVFSKLELNDAELNFKNKVAGLHTFCLKLSSKSRTSADSISSPRVKKKLRTVTVDVQVGEMLSTDRVLGDDIDQMMEEVTDVQQRVQRLISTVVHLKIEGAHHRDVVETKNRTVTVYSVGKLVVMMALFAVQPVVLHAWFNTNQRKF